MPVLLVVAALLAGSATAGAPPATEPGISVSGTGRVSLAPDIVTVDIGAEARAPQLASVAESTAGVRPVGVSMMAVPVEAGQLDVTVIVQARYAIE